MTQFSIDMFADPQKPVSADGPRPTVASFRGRLVMIVPLKIETKPSNMNQGQMEDVVTANVTIVDGAGAVPAMSHGQPTGQMIQGDEFNGMWISNTYLVDQIRPLVGSGRPMIGVIDTKIPGTAAVKGNPWGLIPATMEQKQKAVQYLTNRAVQGAATPTAVPASAPVPSPSTSAPAGSGNPFA